MLLSILSTALIGCMSATVSSDMDTRVSPDGEVVRTTHIDSTSRDKLESNYILLPGGQLSVEEEKDSHGKVKVAGPWHYIYQTKRRYKADAPIPSDYVRKSDITDEKSQNTIQLQILNFVS